MTTISLKLPERLLARLERESRLRNASKSSVIRECLEKELLTTSLEPKSWPKVSAGESFHDKALPILQKAWTRRGRRIPDLATNPKHMEGFGK